MYKRQVFKVSKGNVVNADFKANVAKQVLQVLTVVMVTMVLTVHKVFKVSKGNVVNADFKVAGRDGQDADMATVNSNTNRSMESANDIGTLKGDVATNTQTIG